MAGKIVEKDATVKVARQRLSVLEMAETLGNIGHVKNFAHICRSPNAKQLAAR